MNIIYMKIIYWNGRDKDFRFLSETSSHSILMVLFHVCRIISEKKIHLQSVCLPLSSQKTVTQMFREFAAQLTMAESSVCRDDRAISSMIILQEDHSIHPVWLAHGLSLCVSEITPRSWWCRLCAVGAWRSLLRNRNVFRIGLDSYRVQSSPWS